MNDRMTWKSSGLRWMAAMLLAAAVTQVDGQQEDEQQAAARHQSDFVLPRLTPGVQLNRPGDLATILLAQSDQPTPSQPAGEDTILVRIVERRPLKSPKRAFLMSVLVPGSGEFWAGSKKRALLFFGLEVLGQGIRLNWKGKGNDLEDDFRARADSTYDPWNYLAWRDSRNSRFSSITHTLPCSAYVKAAPSSVPVPDAIRDCPGSDKQQFYELIGKYDQFVSGWVDLRDGWDPVAKDWEDPVNKGNRVVSTEVDSAENFQSEIRLSYEIDRDESNKYLKRASTLGGLILVNHVLSAIDASRVARARSEGQHEAVIDRRTRFGLALGGSAGTTPMLMAYRPLE